MLRSFIGVAICALYIVMAASTAQAIELLEGLSGKYPNDDGIANDPAVLFTENFERGNLSEWQEKKGTASLTMEHAHSGHASLAIPMARGKSTGGHLVKWFMPGAESVHVRFYVKISRNYQYLHHVVWLLANPANDRWLEHYGYDKGDPTKQFWKDEQCV